MHPFFERRVKVVASGCWLWPGSINNWGYGRTETSLSKERAAHRLSWALHKGPIPPGMNVLHQCDLRRCVNPDHLFLGTIADNNADMMAKGRHRSLRGEESGTAKLTKAAVSDIRSRTVFYGSISEWAREFNVSRRSIRSALIGETWR